MVLTKGWLSSVIPMVFVSVPLSVTEMVLLMEKTLGLLMVYSLVSASVLGWDFQLATT
jgi:hypothetical protein